MKKKVNFKYWIGIIFFSFFTFLTPFQSASAITCKCTGAFKFSPSYPGQNLPPDVNFNKCVTSIEPNIPLKDEKDCIDRAYKQFFSENDPKDNFTFNGTCTISPQCDNPLTTAQALKLDIRKPILEIIIPNLKFSDIANTVDENGNLQFPWIGEYIKAVYRFGVSIASILGVIMIIVEGVRIVISAGGEEKVAGYKHIGRICAGLCLAWFSYVILYNINSDLVSFQALKIKLADDTTEVDDGNYEMTADESRSLSTEFKSMFKNSPFTAGIDLATFDEPWWKNQRWDGKSPPDSDPKLFTCAKYYADPAKYPPRGVVPTTAITEPYDCGGLLPSPIRTIPQMQEGICKVAQLAKNDGYKLSITSSYRPFKDQVTGYCPGQQDSASARASHAVPGYSNHGRGQAVDAKLSKDGRQLTGYDYWCQCLYDVNDWNRLADYFYQANPNFYRLNIESWHFEYRPQRGGSVYRDAQGHGHAIQCSKITPAQIASCQKKK
jgi:hypothetical protein